MSKRASLLVALSLVSLGAACGGGTSSAVATAAGPSPVNVNRLPDWFTNVPTDANTMYAATTAESRDLQLAINKAVTDGRNNLAQQMEVKFEGLSKRFQEETGLGADAQLIDQFTQAYKGIVSQTINGSRAAKQEIVNTPAGYRAYVLVELPIGQASQALMQRVRANEQMYTRFRASQAFDELQKEVERYEAAQRPRP
ncbi:MAG: LPP20 family lipoprotein [Gemmatimonadota bacterium]|jgi:hypothetical protein|nr:LPP20 family lipoprotein [Gemmatimonadota bacterium]MDQ8146873.1 LPP20 family lipoprotein [Gemmatimonadota bacterium]MDQ8148541.1 LPP20 family lipoprotein [Gemmatimonadota bacterium]MDQ8156424.1 LPP20 family lipoprotein [Gemmatimonadota bacterium]MDQ8170794.1 LPP20 family lipoprotein [Gemmatimonadota bacterium]